MRRIALTVNGVRREAEVEPRLLLVYFLRETLGLTGTNVGCDTSSCGACTVLMDGKSVKSCTVLAVQADGSEVTTIEGLATDGQLLAGEHGHHPGQLPGRGGVDAGDGGVGDRATRERQPQHAGEGDVLDEATLASDELGVLLADQAASDPALGLRLGYLCHSDPPWTAAGCAAAGAAWRISPAASWIALTMFW